MSKFNSRYLITNVHGDIYTNADTLQEVKQLVEKSGLTKLLVFERAYEVTVKTAVSVTLVAEDGNVLVL